MDITFKLHLSDIRRIPCGFLGQPALKAASAIDFIKPLTRQEDWVRLAGMTRPSLDY
jgi:hypothetical protein